jgi:uncharacterized protein YfaS (alpha-2-macroglobulin family)
LKLLKITYRDGRPIETPVQTWQLDTNAEGVAGQQITASQAGQYRLSYTVTDRGERREERGQGRDERGESTATTSPRALAGEGPGVRAAGVGIDGASLNSQNSSPHPNPLPKGEGTRSHTIEGGFVFTVVGEGFDGAQFRFNHLELVPDKREYAPGDTVKLQINTDRTGGTVLLFARPTNGVYLPPKVICLDGKSTIEEIGVVQKDMPNFFVEAVTVADGRTFTEAREIVVPPEKRILNVEIRPSKEAYKPGERAQVKIKLTDLAGRAFVGSTVVAIYDKSVEYISGGSNVPDIKEFFWKWRRQHYPHTESSLDRWFPNLIPPKTIGMGDLGIFGGRAGEASAERDANVFFQDGEVADVTRIRHSTNALRESTVSGAGAPMMAAPPATAMLAKSGAEYKYSIPKPGWSNGDGGRAPMIEPTIRTKFADTALWVGALTTAEDGTAEVSLDMPENLTTWRIKVWGMGNGTRVGQGFADVVTRKDLIIRMEAPRFFVQTDEVVLSAIVHNYLKTKKTVQVTLELGGNCLDIIIPARTKPEFPRKTVVIEPNSEARVDWLVYVLDEGQAVIRMKALTDEESDAIEQRFPCYIHGMPKTDSYCGEIRPDGASGKFTVTVPKDRRPAESRLEVRFSPTLAGAMVDALPYLVAYPYGCTEQTLNRFLPTVITQKILLDMHLDLKEIEKKRTNLALVGSGQWPVVSGQGDGASFPRLSPLAPRPLLRNPVFDQDEVRKMVKVGVERLTEMQCSDGGWGWFSGWGEFSAPHTTAQVVHGLWLARQNDVALVPGVLERGVEWLKSYQAQQVQLIKNAAVKDKPPDMQWKDLADNLDAFIYMVLVDADVKDADMLDFLYRDRTKLSVYGLTMYGIALDKQGEQEKLAMIMKNIGQYVEQDDENQTAWLRMPQDAWWRWYGSEFEAEAYYLKLLSRSDPKGELARRLVKYLLNNRRNATYWNSTRDTALCVEAFAEFIRRSGEDRPEMTVDVYYDGKLQKAVEITPKNLLTFDNKFVLEGDALTAGQHTVELKRKGAGPLYYNGYLTNFTLEDFIKHAGLEVKVNRKYYKLTKAEKSIHAAGSRGQVVEERVEKYDRQELPNLAELKSGDLVEVELEIQSKNDYEYLVFEDMKPAGFEPVDLRSGYTGNDLGAYVEFRDNHVVFFTRALARGRHSVSYRMRAEIPGRFSALPTRAWAMYAPELKGNSDELKIGVKD